MSSVPRRLMRFMHHIFGRPDLAFDSTGRRFSALTAPLTRTALCSPRARFMRGDDKQWSFDALKAALTSAPVLRV